MVRWGEDEPVVLAAHGITASHACRGAVVAALPEGATFLAPDLRGRGASGVRLAAAHPDRVDRLVIVDGGLPLPVPSGIDPGRVVEATLDPAFGRLRQTLPSLEDYLGFWRAHPALAGSGAWNEHVEAYLAYDLEGAPPRLRPRASEDAVRADGIDLLDEEAAGEALAGVRCPTRLIRAERLLDQPEPLVPEEVLERGRVRQPGLVEETVPGSNHYTILLAEPGASVIAARLLSLP